MNNFPEDSARKSHRIASARHLNLQNLMREHYAGSELVEARGRILALFLSKSPYTLTYNYLKKSSGYRKDKPVLDALINEGALRVIEKTRSKITFEFIGELADGQFK